MSKNIGRNEPCLCKSGKKYKNCCLKRDTQPSAKTWEDLVMEAGLLSMNNTAEGPREAVELIEELLKMPGLTSGQQVHGLVNLSRALQHGGDFRKALKVLNEIEIPEHFESRKGIETHTLLDKASCLSALGEHSTASKHAANVLNSLPELPCSEHAGMLLQCGKIFDLAGDRSRAENCWARGLKAAKGEASQLEIYARTLANLASLKLSDENKATQQNGLQMMQVAAALKLQIGDLHGLANSYDLLGLYYFRNRQFEPAIAYLRKDLALSEQVGDARGLAQTLTNLAGLYMEMRQVKAARQSLKRAKAIADELGNPDLRKFVSYQARLVETHAREIAAAGEPFGLKAPCACGSGRSYEQCCGRADFAPIDLPWSPGGRSQDTQQLDRDLCGKGIKPTRLDSFLAEWGKAKDRFGWYKVFPRRGWHEVQVLPDMAGIQLAAARKAAEEAARDNKSLEWPLSALVMSVCALESFINQLAFFIIEVGEHGETGLGLAPREIMTDLFAFQRAKLTEKWTLLGNFLCGSAWPPSCWSQFVNVVFVRNEFVHFKITNYEQVIPPPSTPPKIIHRLPPDFELREVGYSWPLRILTPKLAEWAVSVADGMFKALRHGYTHRRGTSPSTP